MCTADRESGRFRGLNFLRCRDFFHFSTLRDTVVPLRPWNETCYYRLWNMYFPQAEWFEQHKLFETFENKKKISLFSCFAMTYFHSMFSRASHRKGEVIYHLLNAISKHFKHFPTKIFKISSNLYDLYFIYG